MGTRSFPGWSGPVVGAAAGLGLGLSRGLGDGPGVAAPWLALWAAAGAAAGCVVWLLDVAARRRRQRARRTRRPVVESPAVRAGLWTWLALMLAVGPFVGYLGTERVLAARRMSRWPTAEATVVESRVKVSSHAGLGVATESFAPVVRYRYATDGVEREGRAVDLLPPDVSYSERDRADAIVARYPARSTHAAYYDPADPARAVLEPEMPWGEVFLYILIPVAALGMAAVAAVSLRAEQRDSPAA